MENINFLLTMVIAMTSSFLSIKNKSSIVLLMVFAFPLVFPMEKAKAEVPMFKFQVAENDVPSQSELLSISIRKVDDRHYLVQTDLLVKQQSLEDIQNYIKPSGKGLKISLKTTRKEVKEEMIKKLSRPVPPSENVDFLPE